MNWPPFIPTGNRYAGPRSATWCSPGLPAPSHFAAYADRLAYVQISAYNCGMRRKAGTLIPLELSILAAARQLCSQGEDEFYGFRIAKVMKVDGNARRLTAHGTLYRALARLEQRGLLHSRWEDPETAALRNRPRRKLYKISGAATAVLSSYPVHGSEPLRAAWSTEYGLENA